MDELNPNWAGGQVFRVINDLGHWQSGLSCGDVENLNGWIFHEGYARVYRIYPTQISYALGPGDQRYVGLSVRNARRAHTFRHTCNC